MKPTTTTSILLSSLLLTLTSARYTLTDDYNPHTFFGNFTFFNLTDPTNGHTKFLNQSAASDSSLAGFLPHQDNAIYLGVDYTSPAPTGRPALRLSSKKSFNKGLFLADISHMPSGCGVWPAFWMNGADPWPQNGEIDILEGVNSQTSNKITLHTNAGCSVDPATPLSSGPASSSNSSSSSGSGALSASFTGTMSTPDCNIAAPKQLKNAGCQIADPSLTSYGAGFNAANGGLFATEWTSTAISIWFFPRASIPAGLLASPNPDPSGWGAPVARFAGQCDIDAHFKDMNIIFDTTFCGDWAGESWGEDKECSAKAKTCNEWVESNPGEFKDAYWGINGVRVFESS